MKKRRNKLVTLGMAAMMTAALMSGCGKKATPENLLKDMAKNMKDTESVVANMKMDMEMGDDTTTIGIQMDMDIDMDLKSGQSHAKGAVDMKMMGTNVGTEIEMYTVKEKDQYIVYTMANDQWQKEEMDDSAADMAGELSDLTGSMGGHAKSFEMSKEKVEVNGEKCFEMKGEIKGSDIVGMMESGMADSLGSEIDEDVIKDLELPCTIAVYEDDILPAKISFDMQDIMEKAMEEEGVDVSACSIEVTYHEYDSVGEIKVPNDVIEKAGGEVSDDKEDKEDKDDDKKADKPAEQSKELGVKWDSYTVQINDKVLKLPCSLADLEATGLKLDREYTPEDYVVNAGEYELAWFEDENGNTIMADMVNTGDDPKALKDCIVGAISVDDYDLEEGGLTVLFPGGITVGTKEADVLAAYGEPTDSYKDEEYGNTYYWYDKESYDNSCTVETDAETGLVENITLQCYE